MNKLKTFGSWIGKYGIYLIIFCILFSVRIYAISNKTSFFFDDPASLIVSTPNNLYEDGTKIKYGWADLRFDYEKNYNILSVKKVLFESKSDIKSIISDLVYLHNQTLDTQHPNLYYSILRIWTAGMDYSNKDAIKWRGCSCSLLFFIFSFFFMFKLLNLIRPEKKFIATGLFFAFITTGTISTTLLIRSYPLMEAFLIAALYIFIKLLKAIEEKEILPIKKLFLYGFCMGLFFLTEYFALFIGAFILIALFCKCIAMRDFKWLVRVIFIFMIALGFTYSFCPLYFVNFKTMEHLDTVHSLANIWNFLCFNEYGMYMLNFLNKYVFSNIVPFLVLLALMAIGIPITNNNKLEKKEAENLFIVIATVFSWTYIMSVISPFHEPPAVRYIITGFPILSLIIGYMVYRLKIFYALLITIFTITSTIYPIMKGGEWCKENKCISEIAYLNDNTRFNINYAVYSQETYEKLPIVVINKGWSFPNFILYLDGNNIIRFEKFPPRFENYIFSDYVLLNNEYAMVHSKYGEIYF